MTEIENVVFLLIFTEPKEAEQSLKGKVRSFSVEKIYLFNEKELCDQLAGKVKTGTYTSVKS